MHKFWTPHLITTTVVDDGIPNVSVVLDLARYSAL